MLKNSVEKLESRFTNRQAIEEYPPTQAFHLSALRYQRSKTHENCIASTSCDKSSAILTGSPTLLLQAVQAPEINWLSSSDTPLHNKNAARLPYFQDYEFYRTLRTLALSLQICMDHDVLAQNILEDTRRY